MDQTTPAMIEPSFADLPWLLEVDRLRVTNQPSAAAAIEPKRPRLIMLNAFQPPANDSFTDLLVVGWAQGALDLVRSDSVLMAKRILWLVRPEQVTYLAAAAVHGAPPQWRVALCDDRGQLPYLLESLPSCFSLAVLDEELCSPRDLVLLGQTRFNRSMSTLERGVKDHRYLLDRLPHLHRSTPLRTFKNAYAGQTALCLAAGPSLDQHLELVRRVQDRCVVIVVDVLQKRLQERGFKVDFVVTVDSDQRLCDRMGTPPDAETVLIQPINGHRGLDAKFQRQAFFMHGPMGEWLLGEDPTFHTGTSVGIATVGFAHFLGCHEVVLIGHDLSYGPSTMYSDLVAGRESHQVDMYAEANQMKRTIPGNDGGLVDTDYLFEVAVQDLSIMLRTTAGMTVYNLNCNTRSGARIEHTLPLPEGWEPTSTVAVQRPPHGEPLAPTPTDDPVKQFLTVLHDQRDRVATGWKNLRAMGHSDLVVERLMMLPTEVRLGMMQLNQLFQPLQLLAMRAQSLPPSIGCEWYHARLRSLLDQSLVAGQEFWDRVSDPDKEIGSDVLEGKPWPWSDAQRAYLDRLRSSTGIVNTMAADSLLMPIIYRVLMGYRRALPSLALPTPRAAHDGLMLVAGLGTWVDEPFLIQVLCLCALEGVDHPLIWVREGEGILPEDHLPGIHQRGDQARDELAATGAILRLRAGKAGHIAAETAAALRWPPAHLHLVRILAQGGATELEQLARIIARGELKLDDQMVAQILLHVRDLPRASHLVKDATSVIGEASVMAMAHRYAETGQAERALTVLVEIRPLSRFRDQAINLRCQILEQLGRHAEVTALVDDLTDTELQAHWRNRVPNDPVQIMARLDALEQKDSAPPVQMLARISEIAWKKRDARMLERVFLLLLRYGMVSGLEVRAYEQLANALVPMLGAVGLSAQELKDREISRLRNRTTEQLAEGLHNELCRWIGERWQHGIPVTADQALLSSGLLDMTAISELCQVVNLRCRTSLGDTDLIRQVDTVGELVRLVYPQSEASAKSS